MLVFYIITWHRRVECGGRSPLARREDTFSWHACSLLECFSLFGPDVRVCRKTSRTVPLRPPLRRIPPLFLLRQSLRQRLSVGFLSPSPVRQMARASVRQFRSLPQRRLLTRSTRSVYTWTVSLCFTRPMPTLIK